jgi:hypothetical protein
MENKIAKTISYFFHPLLMLLYGLIVLFNLNANISLLLSLQGKLYILAIAFISGVIFPLSFMFFLLKSKVIKSFALETKEERTIPYLMTGVFYYFIFYLFKEINLPPLFYVFVLNSTLIILITLLINFWWKISAHMIAIGSIIGTLIGISIKFNMNLILIIAIILIISGLVGFSRLKLNAHNNAQIYCGFLLGLSCMMTLFILI